MWNSVLGQERIKIYLQQALSSQKLPSAYLFSGPEGVGKDAVAIELAKAVNCVDPDIGGKESCGKCHNCVSITTFTSSLIHFIVADGTDRTTASSKVKDELTVAMRAELSAKSSDPYHRITLPKALAINVSQIRGLRTMLAQSLVGGKKRVVIISGADMMNIPAQNAFLKTLEEPHADTLIILTSSSPSRLLPTIHSRVQEIRFDMLTPEVIAEGLHERDGIDAEQAIFLSRLAGGSFSVARSFVNEDISDLRDKVVLLLQEGLKPSRAGVMTVIDTLSPRQGGSFIEKRQTIEKFLHLLGLWLRDALALSASQPDIVMNQDKLQLLERFNTKFGKPDALLRAMKAVETARSNVRLQLQLRPVLLVMMMEIESALIR